MPPTIPRSTAASARAFVVAAAMFLLHAGCGQQADSQPQHLVQVKTAPTAEEIETFTPKRLSAEHLPNPWQIHPKVISGGLPEGDSAFRQLAELGVKTTVIEIAPRILARVCDAETSALIHARHRAHGVEIRLDTAVSARREAVQSGNLRTAWDASAAAAGSMMLLARARADVDALLKPPQLR